MKIKVLEKTEGCFPQEFAIGDWIDLSVAEDVTLQCPKACKLHRRKDKNKENNTNQEERIRDVIFDTKLLPLGIAMDIPSGFEAWLLPRSGTFGKYGIIQTNSKGIIDNSYAGDGDEWKMPVLATRRVTIPKGMRIAQFRICLKQNATLWQKFKWLFTSKKVKLVKVDSLGNPDRGGLGNGTGDK